VKDQLLIEGYKESFLKGLLVRILQILARIGPGATSLRVYLHRLRGVTIGKNAWIGSDVILDTSCPQQIEIGDNVSLGMRTTVIAHFRTLFGVTIGDDVFIGPGSIILPNVKIGKGAVVAAGSVVNQSVAPHTVVQGNPAVPVAECNVPLTLNTTFKEYMKNLSSLKK